MSMNVSAENLAHELERIHTLTEQLRGQSPEQRRGTIGELVVVIYALHRLELISQEDAAALHNAAQSIDSELACTVER